MQADHNLLNANVKYSQKSSGIGFLKVISPFCSIATGLSGSNPQIVNEIPRGQLLDMSQDIFL